MQLIPPAKMRPSWTAEYLYLRVPPAARLNSEDLWQREGKTGKRSKVPATARSRVPTCLIRFGRPLSGWNGRCSAAAISARRRLAGRGPAAGFAAGRRFAWYGGSVGLLGRILPRSAQLVPLVQIWHLRQPGHGTAIMRGGPGMRRGCDRAGHMRWKIPPHASRDARLCRGGAHWR